jgi:gliding motility-associated-like protein
LSASVTGTNITCFGASNGVADLTVSGGTAPYTYAWSNSSTNEDLSNLSAGNYDVTITDANNCIATATITITQPSASLSASVIGTNITCFGASNGAADLTVSGGTAPYTYAWSNSSTNEDLSNLSVGNYDVTITDANNCTTTATVTITQPSAVLSASINGTNVLCFGNTTGAADLTVSGGTAPYTYAWSNSSTTEDLSNLTAGNYDVTITDANNCTSTATVTITQPSAVLSASINGTNVLCYGNTTGAADLTVSGGTAPYTYSWTNGATTEDVNSLAAGSYTATITDANNCTATATVTITQPSAVLSASINGTNVLCFGNTTGAADLTVSGGTAPYTYAWSNSSTAEDLSNLSAGNYDLTITDANNCTTTATVTITQPSAALSASINGTNVLCFGNTTGAADLTVSGGTAPYTYAWSNSSTNEDLSNIAAGNYDVTITDANNCTATATVTITQPSAALSAIINGTNVLCYGNTTGAADLIVTGGSAPYTYAWSNSSTAEDLSNLVAGNYNVTITDANNCIIIDSVLITEPNSLNQTISANSCGTYVFNGDTLTTTGVYTFPFISINGCDSIITLNLTVVPVNSFNNITSNYNNQEVCENEFIQEIKFVTTGYNNVSFAGLSPYFNATWNSDTVLITGASPVSGLTTYTVYLNGGCSNSNDSIVGLITIHPKPSISLTPSPVLCFGGNTGSINNINSGGNTFTYAWLNPNYDTVSVNQHLTNASAGTYSVYVTNDFGCNSIAIETILQPDSLVATISSVSNVLCYGDSSGSFSVNVIGGIAPYQFSVNGGSVSSTNSFNNLPANNYAVVINDTNNCLTNLSVTIAEPSILTTSVIIQNGITCNGDSTGSFALNTSGGSGNYTYSINSGSYTSLANYSGLAASNYLIETRDLNNCLHTTTAIITNTPLIVPQFDSINSICYGAPFNLPSTSMNGISGTWTPAPNSNVTTTYTFTPDSGQCASSVQTTVIVNQFTILDTSSVTDCGNSQGFVRVDAVIGGTAPFTYQLTNFGPPQSSQYFNNLPSGNFYLLVTDGNGCTKSDTFNISSVQPLSINFTTANAFCAPLTNASISASINGGTQPYQYYWLNTNDTTSTITNIIPGTYTLVIYDKYSCSINDTILIANPVPITSAISSVQQVSCFGGSNGSAIINTTGGTLPYNFSLNGGLNSTSSSFNNLNSGNYQVVISDANNCRDTISFVINQPDSLILNLVSQINPTCFGDTTGSITVLAAGGISPFDYSINNGNYTSNNSFINLIPGSYTVSTKDSNSCVVNRVVVITEPPRITLVNQVVSNVSCNGLSNGAAQATASGGLPPYQYSWNTIPAQTGNTIANLTAGNYVLTVRDSLNCQDTFNLSVTEPALLDVVISSQTNSTGVGLNNGSASATVSGGTIPYSYQWSSNVIDTLNSVANLAAGNFVVVVYDANGCVDSATVTITEMNTLNPEFIVISTNTIANVNVFANDQNTFGLSLDTLAVLNPQIGVVNVSSTGAVSYTPTSNYSGYDKLVVRACSQQNVCLFDTVYITVRPLAQNDYFQTNGNANAAAATGNVTVNDAGIGISGTVTLLNNVSNGTLQIDANGSFLYRPTRNFCGLDSFRYQICDTNNLCSVATCVFEVTCREVTIHTGFSPNGDGINDVWVLPDIEGTINTVSVFDRWGRMVKSFTNYDNVNVFWDGTNSSGAELPSGTYFYSIEVENQKVKKGWIEITK